MYISPSSKHSSNFKEIEVLLKDISKLMCSPVLIVGDLYNYFLKQNKFSSSYSNFLQYNEMTQLLATATRITIDSLTLIDHVFYNHSFDNPNFGMFKAGLID